MCGARVPTFPNLFKAHLYEMRELDIKLVAVENSLRTFEANSTKSSLYRRKRGAPIRLGRRIYDCLSLWWPQALLSLLMLAAVDSAGDWEMSCSEFNLIPSEQSSANAADKNSCSFGLALVSLLTFSSRNCRKSQTRNENTLWCSDKWLLLDRTNEAYDILL